MTTSRTIVWLRVITIMLCISTVAHASLVEWKIADGGNGNLYEAVLIGEDITWEEAQMAVAARGPGWYLATITSAAENAFVEALLEENLFNCCLNPIPIGRISSGPWLGAFSSAIGSNDWQWVTGEPFVFADWGPFEPFGNGNRISYAEFGFGRLVAWNDMPSEYRSLSPRSYVAEFSGSAPIPEPSPLLLLAFGVMSLSLWRWINQQVNSRLD